MRLTVNDKVTFKEFPKRCGQKSRITNTGCTAVFTNFENVWKDTDHFFYFLICGAVIGLFPNIKIPFKRKYDGLAYKRSSI